MKRMGSIVLSCVLILAGAAALAGYTQPAVVIIDLDAQYAQGDQYTARTADNDVESIGCGIRIFDSLGNPFEFGFCQATDSDEVYISCFTQNPDLLEAMRSNSAFSFITFSWDENGECTRIGFSTQSFYLPHFTTKGSN